MQNAHVDFIYKGVDYHADVQEAMIFNQGIAAVANLINKSFRGTNMLVDIGNGTMNVMNINEKTAILESCFTEKYGMKAIMFAPPSCSGKRCAISANRHRLRAARSVRSCVTAFRAGRSVRSTVSRSMASSGHGYGMRTVNKNVNETIQTLKSSCPCWSRALSRSRILRMCRSRRRRSIDISETTIREIGMVICAMTKYRRRTQYELHRHDGESLDEHISK